MRIYGLRRLPSAWFVLAMGVLGLAMALPGRSDAPRTPGGVGLQGASPSPPKFRELWRVQLAGSAHMMIIKDGIVYTQWTSGLLSAVELDTGKILHTATNVAFMTAPFVSGNKVYSYNVGALYEFDVNTFEQLRTIPIPGGGYAENFPYDAEHDHYFLWRTTVEGQAVFSAIQLADGQDAWVTEFTFGAAENNSGSPLLPGDDSVYVQSADGVNHVWRLDKATGGVRWRADLAPGDLVDFNNMIYDRAHDVLYAATTNAVCYAINRVDGRVLWSQAFPGFEVHSTLSYHAGQVYVPLFRAWYGPGATAALDATNGMPRWIEASTLGSDGWSAMAVDDRYLYRGTHGEVGRINIRDRLTGRLVWSGDAGYPQPCTNPVQSAGIVVFGNAATLIALEVGRGLKVDCPWHGVNGTGYNPGAILWDDPAPDLDEDQDGLPDPWELAEFGHLFYSGDEDLDGDGQSNRDEYLAGTSCRRPEESLRLTIAFDHRPPLVTFLTRKTAGIGYEGLDRFYAIEIATDLTNPIWAPLPDAARIPANDQSVTFPLAASPADCFFRVRAWLEPQ